MYFVAWWMSALALLWAFCGLPFWLALAAVTYFSSRRSRAAFADTREQTGMADPQVTRYAQPVKIAAAITAGALCLGVIVIGLGIVLPGRGPVPMGLLSAGTSLLWSVPAMSAGLATLFIASICEIRRGDLVAGRDSAIAYTLTTGIQAALLVCALVAAGGHVQLL